MRRYFYEKELEKRIAFIHTQMEKAGVDALVFGNSGGKDSALVGILCKKACDNTLGVIMPCSSKQNYGRDKEDALKLAKTFDIPTKIVDLTAVREAEIEAVGEQLSDAAVANIAPRLRMATLYLIAHSRKALVVGTGNRSEAYMGYFTKWGDGAYDLNPIADLTVTEIYEFLRFLGAPDSIIEKAPSAGLFAGQTDEAEMGVTYAEIDRFLLYGEKGENFSVIEKYHVSSEHKRIMPVVYSDTVI